MAWVKPSSSREEKTVIIIKLGSVAQSALEDEGFLHSKVHPDSTNEVWKNSKLFSPYYREERGLKMHSVTLPFLQHALVCHGSPETCPHRIPVCQRCSLKSQMALPCCLENMHVQNPEPGNRPEIGAWYFLRWADTHSAECTFDCLSIKENKYCNKIQRPPSINIYFSSTYYHCNYKIFISFKQVYSILKERFWHLK